jgi:putative transposase
LIEPVGQVWAADATDIPMARGILYLVAIIDWVSRYVVVWRPSNRLEAAFCVDALTLSRGRPEIFNTGQGRPFTGAAFTELLLAHGIRISMVGLGRFTDNIFVERPGRSVEYEEAYLHAYDSAAEARAGIGRYRRFYNDQRPRQALGYRTPREVFEAARAETGGSVDIAAAISTTPQAQQQLQAFEKLGRMQGEPVARS